MNTTSNTVGPGPIQRKTLGRQSEGHFSNARDDRNLTKSSVNSSKYLRSRNKLDIPQISQAALRHLPAMLNRWLADGQVNGGEWVALNPTRADKHLGSFRINLRSGHWADFATGDKGGDVVSLAAYLFRLSQGEAARRVAGMIGIEVSRG